jgi:large subunit ribosomal protein L32
MGPLPKRKFSWGRTHRRRAHDAIKAIHLITCDNCGEKKPPHIVCPACGHYKGREVVKVGSGSEKKSDSK